MTGGVLGGNHTGERTLKATVASVISSIYNESRYSDELVSLREYSDSIWLDCMRPKDIYHHSWFTSTGYQTWRLYTLFL